jgi:hypothetical protein
MRPPRPALPGGTGAIINVRFQPRSSGFGGGLVLAVLQIRVAARWIPCSRATSIEMQVTGVAGTAVYRRHPDAYTD